MIITPLPIGRFTHRLEMTTTPSALLDKHFDVIRFHTIVHRGRFFTPLYIGGIQLAYDVIRVRRPGPPGHQDCPYRNYIIIRIRCYNADSPDIILQPNCLETLFQSSFLIHRPQPSPHTPLKHLNIP